MPETEHTKKKAKKHRKSKNIVSFDSETITKEDADKILLQTDGKSHENGTIKKSKKRKNKNKNVDSAPAENVDEEEEEMTPPTASVREEEEEEAEGEEAAPKPKKRKKLLPIEDASGDKKKTISIRQQKRDQHAKLVTVKRTKAELAMQEKSLNYLSKWKHARSEWKFEKLRQVWLQQNMFDAERIPGQFWDSVLEYFAGARGKVRDMILKEAVAIVEKEEISGEDKVMRARAIVGVLQD